MYGRGKFDLLERRVLLDPRPLRSPVGERSAA